MFHNEWVALCIVNPTAEGQKMDWELNV